MFFRSRGRGVECLCFSVAVDVVLSVNVCFSVAVDVVLSVYVFP